MPTLTITREAPDGSSDDVAIVTIAEDDDPQAQALDTLRGTAWPSGTYLLGVGDDNAGTLEYVADHAREHPKRLPWLRCADIACTIPAEAHAMVDRTAAVRAAAARDGRCHPDDAQALLELIEHSRDAAAAVTLPGARYLHDSGDVAADAAVEFTRASTIAGVGASVLQALVVDDDPVRWSHVLADEVQRQSCVPSWGGHGAQVRNALRPHALEAVRAILSTMRRSINAWELLAVTAGVRFGGFELTREIERRDREYNGVQP